ncbi:MAG: carbohydrate ABC transporter permease [Ilumatobacteraceae bacterium]
MARRSRRSCSSSTSSSHSATSEPDGARREAVRPPCAVRRLRLARRGILRAAARCGCCSPRSTNHRVSLPLCRAHRRSPTSATSSTTRKCCASLGNSLLLVGGVVGLVLLVGAPAAYVLSRIHFPGRNLFLYMLLLLSSVITGAAAIVPLYLLIFGLNLIDSFSGVTLALAGGMLPASIFILKDFTDSIPRSYEESARVFGASTFQALRDVVFPVVRPGLAVIAVWTAVQVWGNFLRAVHPAADADKSPAAVLMYSFYTEGGQPNLRLISAFSLLYTIPILVLYIFVNRRYGFRFHGGIKR